MKTKLAHAFLSAACALSFAGCGGEIGTFEDGVDDAEGDALNARFLSGSTTQKGFYIYPERSMLLLCSGGTAHVQALDVPNRFSVKDSRGNLVAVSPWLGHADYPGPWGSSLSPASAQVADLAFRGAGVFELVVETSAQPGGLDDAWEVSYGPTGCSTGTPRGDSPGCPGGPSTPSIPSTPPPEPPCTLSVSALDDLSGSLEANKGYFVYPAKRISVSSSCAGKSISVSVLAHDVPNRFTVRDASGASLAMSSWLGSSSEYGFWGGPFSNAGGEVLSVPVAQGDSTITLVAETSTTSVSDYWSASAY